MGVIVRPHGVKDEATARALDDLAAAAIGPGLLTGAVLMESVDLSADTVVRVKHNLGRRAKGYLVVGRRNVVIAPVRRLISSADFYPYTEAGNWEPPSGSTDYWELVDNTETLHMPMHVNVGETLLGIELAVYSAATDPVPTLYAADYNDSGGSSVTPTVAWSAVPTTTWTKMTATYNHVIVAETNYYLSILAAAIGDRIRYGILDVRPTTAPAVHDENDQHGDLDKFLYLKSVGGSMTVDLAVF